MLLRNVYKTIKVVRYSFERFRWFLQPVGRGVRTRTQRALVLILNFGVASLS